MTTSPFEMADPPSCGVYTVAVQRAGVCGELRLEVASGGGHSGPRQVSCAVVTTDACPFPLSPPAFENLCGKSTNAKWKQSLKLGSHPHVSVGRFLDQQQLEGPSSHQAAVQRDLLTRQCYTLTPDQATAMARASNAADLSAQPGCYLAVAMPADSAPGAAPTAPGLLTVVQLLERLPGGVGLVVTLDKQVAHLVALHAGPSAGSALPACIVITPPYAHCFTPSTQAAARGPVPTRQASAPAALPAAPASAPPPSAPSGLTRAGSRRRKRSTWGDAPGTGGGGSSPSTTRRSGSGSLGDDDDVWAMGPHAAVPDLGPDPLERLLVAAEEILGPQQQDSRPASPRPSKRAAVVATATAAAPPAAHATPMSFGTIESAGGGGRGGAPPAVQAMDAGSSPLSDGSGSAGSQSTNSNNNQLVLLLLDRHMRIAELEQQLLQRNAQLAALASLLAAQGGGSPTTGPSTTFGMKDGGLAPHIVSSPSDADSATTAAAAAAGLEATSASLQRAGSGVCTAGSADAPGLERELAAARAANQQLDAVNAMLLAQCRRLVQEQASGVVMRPPILVPPALQ